LPAFIRGEIGEQALQRANSAAGFDAELIEDRNCYISQRSVLDFVGALARSVGVHDFGLLLAPSMNVADYGTFGRYIFAAETLGQAIKRSIAALRYHSTFDTLSLTTCGNELRYSYAFALAGSQEYGPVASAAAGELISIFRAYLPENWRPIRIELDIPKPTRTSHFEDVFQCPVIFDAPAVTIVTERHRMTAASKRMSRSIFTIEDVARDRSGGAPQGLMEVAFAQIRAQLYTGDVSIEEVARSMETSVRSLQRELNRAGTDFRTLTSAVKIERATELLHDTTVSITSISEDLGYASPAGFSRAFRKATGLEPREHRKRERSSLLGAALEEIEQDVA
jgi:AraC-like DNA-binding protein